MIALFFVYLTFERCRDIIKPKGVFALKRTCKLCGAEFESAHNVLCPDCRVRKCVICGKEFELKNPYTQVTCSKSCSGVYRKQSGISTKVAEKAKATLLEKYGVENPSKVGGPTHTKICKYCGKEFMPKAFGQMYCDDDHFGECPICGKPVKITDYYKATPCCSPECTMKLRENTCIEKYGDKYAVTSQHGREKALQTSLAKYGAPWYSMTDEYKQRYKTTLLNRYGVTSPLQSDDIRKKWYSTNLSKYGVKVPTQSPQVKAKIVATALAHGGFGMQRPDVRQRIEATNLVKYGSKSTLANTDVRAKAKQTMLQRYGAENPMNCESIKNRIEATNIERYGTKTPLANPDIKQKALYTLFTHYGVMNPMDSPELVQKSQENLRATMLLKYGAPYSMQVPSIVQKISNSVMIKYGVPWYCITDDCNRANSHRISLPNRLLSVRLEEAGIAYEFEKSVEHKPYDIYVYDTNTLIEVDPTYTHNAIGNHWDSSGKDSKYHLEKTQIATRNGYKCIHIFDWDRIDKVINIISPKIPIYARSCEVRKVPIMEGLLFENYNHLQGSVRGQTHLLGLYYNDELVELMSFGTPRYNKAYQWELLRLCTKVGYKVIGGASKLFKYFINKFNPESIISYCDLAKFGGEVYKAIGMFLDHTSVPAKHWSKSTEHITDNLLRQRGYDQLFGTNYGKGTSNEQLMLDNGWLPVYDCGQAVFVWNNN